MDERMAIITYPNEFCKQEAWELVLSAGYSPIAIFTSKKFGNGKLGLPSGKANSIKEQIQQLEADFIFVDDRIKASQAYELSKFFGGIKVIDRNKLILDIFENRAATAEAKLQVKLAELTYEIPRVKDMVKIRRQGEQTGMFGYGAYEADKYVRSLRRQMHEISRKLDEFKTRKAIQMKKRQEGDFFLVSLAGYTGAGKTTIFNLMSNQTKPITGKYFTTLTTTLRMINGIDGAYISDTVGFIERLPHYMIDSFKSTLEEITYSDLVFLVSDYSLPEDEFYRKYRASINVLKELGVPLSRVTVVLNKVDKRKETYKFQDNEISNWLEISAKKDYNTQSLKSSIINSMKLVENKPL
ncbi:MAG: GTPase HflX [Conexivisphaerales archaeon]